MKKITFLILTLLVFIITNKAYSQLQNANWYFGENGAGLNFDGGTTVLTDGDTNTVNNFTATVSDDIGNLLFYTDGESVWDTNHVEMVGTLNGGGQAVVIVPFPANEKKYYIFTVNLSVSQDNYYYSIVDMDLNNGLGGLEVIDVNLSILPYINVVEEPPSIETKDNIERVNNITVAKHSDGQSYWLILNPFDMFFTFKIDINGVSSNPIISNEFGNGDPFIFPYGSGLVGQSGMSVSPDMNKVAYITRDTSGAQCTLLKVYSFNNSTGQLDWDFSGDCLTFLGQGWSAEFSADGQFLYVLTNVGNYNIYQFDSNNIATSGVVIGVESDNNSSPTLNRTLERAIDNKIYVADGTNKIGVINFPNNIGTSSNFVEDQVNLGIGSALTLPHQTLYYQSLPPTCIDDLIITQAVITGENDIQEASNTITASNIIEVGATAEYDAGNTVTLTPGFHAKSGSTFRAYIDGCVPSQSSQNSSSSENFNSDTAINSNDVHLYPNPASNRLSIVNKNLKIIKVELHNIYGKLISNSKKINTHEYNLSNLNKFTKGYYVVKIYLDDNSIVNKNIIIK